jgi:hypothetical protein
MTYDLESLHRKSFLIMRWKGYVSLKDSLEKTYFDFQTHISETSALRSRSVSKVMYRAQVHEGDTFVTVFKKVYAEVMLTDLAPTTSLLCGKLKLKLKLARDHHYTQPLHTFVGSKSLESPIKPFASNVT